MGAPENVEFIPAGIIESSVSRSVSAVVPAVLERASDPAPSSASDADKTGAIEITLPNGTRVNVDASVNEKPRPVVIVQDDRFDATASITICAFTTDEAEAPLSRL